jgi:hypothetical protein
MPLAAVALALTLAPAPAATPSLYDIYATGHYTEAIKAGTASGTAQGFLIAARATLADATTRPQPCLDCLRRSETAGCACLSRRRDGL